MKPRETRFTFRILNTHKISHSLSFSLSLSPHLLSSLVVPGYKFTFGLHIHITDGMHFPQTRTYTPNAS